ncbi:hypothetical protein FF38_06459 [Lucilia cuprina]|uniref:Uncharacterized protein n=1 Tax=Lucilia cuprina TaxID=7375 RepID=A0A0L0CPJ2_LUCCU|nr:hypothetical protein FF38_06459 [Lucilia cuprina]
MCTERTSSPMMGLKVTREVPLFEQISKSMAWVESLKSTPITLFLFLPGVRKPPREGVITGPIGEEDDSESEVPEPLALLTILLLLFAFKSTIFLLLLCTSLATTVLVVVSFLFSSSESDSEEVEEPEEDSLELEYSDDLSSDSEKNEFSGFLDFFCFELFSFCGVGAGLADRNTFLATSDKTLLLPLLGNMNCFKNLALSPSSSSTNVFAIFRNTSGAILGTFSLYSPISQIIADLAAGTFIKSNSLAICEIMS